MFFCTCIRGARVLTEKYLSVINLIQPQSKLSVFHKMAIYALIHQQFLFVGSYRHVSFSVSLKVELNAFFVLLYLYVICVCVCVSGSVC